MGTLPKVHPCLRWLRIVYLGKCQLGRSLPSLFWFESSLEFHSFSSTSINTTNITMASLMSTVRLGLRTGLKAECRSFVTSTQPATWTRKERHHFFYSGIFLVELDNNPRHGHRREEGRAAMLVHKEKLND